MPLFPIHAISRRPGEHELSTDAKAMGREGVCEIGRDLASLFGFSPTGLLNGGNRVQVHSLVSVGERVSGRSILRDVRSRTGKRGGAMLIFETENKYVSSTGRPLLTESQSIVYRMEQ